MNYQRPDPDKNFLATLSKVPWCVDVLGEIARRDSCTRRELYRFTQENGSTDVTDKMVDRYLSLLESAQLVEAVGGAFKITARGAASAAGLDSAAKGLDEQSEPSPSLKAETPQKNDAHSSNNRFMKKRREASEPGLAKDAPPNRSRRYAITGVAIALLLIVVGWLYLGAGNPGGTGYRFATVERGDLKLVTLSTGQVEAINAVEVSSQLSGQVVALHANFNDHVTAGAPLAQLDDKAFDAAVAEANAQLAHAKASYDSTVAKTAGAEARYTEAQQVFERKQALAQQGSISQQEIDQARARLATAASERDAARADEAIQKAAIDMAAAALRKAEIGLERTVIRSPIDGIVIRRSIELGQTVAVSMEAPTLFTIAHDLTEMRVHARVDEADIGQIKAGQEASFSVSAYPNRSFAGEVVEVHRSPESLQNVVTYKVVITAGNPDLTLFPGMTALVRIATVQRTDALLVPNAALRFEPDTGDPAASGTGRTGGNPAGQMAQVWVRNESGGLSQTEIGIGASDGNMTEVISGTLSEGQAVAIGTQFTEDEGTLFGMRLGF